MVVGELIVTNLLRCFPSVPSTSPPGFAVHGRFHTTSLNVTWNPLPRGSIHGNLLGYKVVYKEISRAGSDVIDGEVKTIVIKNEGSAGQFSVMLRDLTPFTTYSVYVRGFTAVGDGLVSDAVLGGMKISTQWNKY